MSYEMISEKLWDMLDAIDTAGDAYKENHNGYRAFVAQVLKLRHALLRSDGDELKIVTQDYLCENCGEKWNATVLEWECPRCDCPMGGDLRIPFAKDGTQ